MDLYNYRQLEDADEIRVLILAPSGTTDGVNISLEHMRLSDAQEFEAVSYCWGTDSRSNSILCSGAVIKVTDNLFSALQHLALPKQQRRLWVDAVCINQEDDDEKGYQIPLMGQIYATARQTVVWLGDGEDGRGAAIRRVRDICSNTGPQSLITVDVLNDIAPIFKCQWFQRLWVVQEAVLSSQVAVTVGNTDVLMDAIEHILRHLPGIWEHQGLFDVPAAVNLLEIAQMRKAERQRQGSKAPLNILELIQRTERFQVTERKDRVYALYGLTADIDFPVNYSTLYGHNEMFVDFAIWGLHKFPHLAILAYARGVSKICECAGPSWAPCYDMEGLPYTLLEASHFDAFAGGQANISFKMGDNNRSLHVTGAFIDTMASIIIDDGFLYAASPEQRKQYLQNSSEFAKYSHDSDRWDEKYEKFLAAFVLELDFFGGRATEDFIDSVDGYVVGAHGVGVYEERQQLVSDMLGKWARHRCFCVTTGKRFAWAPRRELDIGPEPGDRVCIFQGGRVPYIIRPKADGTYIFLGECWVQGLMEGEALRLAGFKTETIVLV